jgi:hypothetical protein
VASGPAYTLDCDEPAIWTQYLGGSGGAPLMVNPLYLTQMTRIEPLMAGRIQFLIDTMNGVKLP